MRRSRLFGVRRFQTGFFTSKKGKSSGNPRTGKKRFFFLRCFFLYSDEGARHVTRCDIATFLDSPLIPAPWATDKLSICACTDCERPSASYWYPRIVQFAWIWWLWLVVYCSNPLASLLFREHVALIALSCLLKQTKFILSHDNVALTSVHRGQLNAPESD